MKLNKFKVLPPYGQLKYLLNRAVKYELITQDDVDSALWCRDKIYLYEQESARKGEKKPSNEQEKLNEWLASVKDKIAIAFRLMCELETSADYLCNYKKNPEKRLLEGLTNTDISLCAIWSGFDLRPDEGQEIDFLNILLNEVGSIEAGRLLSARAAEKIAIQYLAGVVDDISVQQLVGDSDEWKSSDLRCGDKYFDVKNARNDFLNRGYYSELCVPRFKKSRCNSSEVILFGVVSKNKKDLRAYISGGVEATILGELSIDNLRAIYKWGRRRFGNALDLSGIWNDGLLPGWLFEYSGDHYLFRSSVTTFASELISDFFDNGVPLERIPLWLLLFSNQLKEIPEQESNNYVRRMVVDLNAMHCEIGITKRSLCVYVMGIAIESLRTGQRFGKALVELLSCLYVEYEGASSKLLGLDDPFDYFGAFVSSLTFIENEILTSKVKVVAFRMPHPLILLGLLENGGSIRLLAYCGGRIGRDRCSNSFLCLGKNVICGDCGYLICEICGNCSENCAEGLLRVKGGGALGRRSSDW